jgi:hypothetical protein
MGRYDLRGREIRLRGAAILLPKSSASAYHLLGSSVFGDANDARSIRRIKGYGLRATSSRLQTGTVLVAKPGYTNILADDR